MGLGERLVEKVMNLVVVRNTHDLFKRVLRVTFTSLAKLRAK